MKTLKSTIGLLAFVIGSVTAQSQDFTSFVDPFIGTATVGHTYPAATTPFALVQVGPDTGIKGWEHCSGYHSDDKSIIGFSHTHLSGTGACDMGDILIMPVTGEPQFDPGTDDKPGSGFRSPYSHSTETAKPGYYSVKLDKYNIFAEMTATLRAGFHRYTYPKSVQAGMIIDLDHGMEDVTVESSMKVVDNQTITGYRHSSGFIKDQHIYFCARFSKPFDKAISFIDGEKAEEKDLSGKACKVFLQFKTNKDEKILVKVGLSTASEEGAMKNLDGEITGWNFDAIAASALKTWNEYLSKIDVQTVTDDQKKIFYTALYHCLVSPNLVTDLDGSYRGWDGETNKSTTGDLYTNFSLWDTYRATHPLFALFYPDKNIRFINSMIEIGRASCRERV